MKKLKSYIVGGHRFCVSMDLKSVLWEGMGNYEPFLSEEFNIEPDTSCADILHNSVFCVDIDLSSDGKDIISSSRTLADFDDDTAYISVMSGIGGERIFLISLNSRMKDRCGVLVVDKDLSKCKLYAGTCATGGYGLFVVNNAIMLLYALCTSVMNTLLIHASVAVADGLGYAFLGKSGTGKSTHTRLWLQNITGAYLLNDDNPVVRINERGETMIYGSPWSGKTPCYRNESVPLKAVVRLSQAPYNSIRKLSGVSAYAAVVPSASSMKWERSMADGLHDTLSKLISNVGIYHLECLPDADAAFLCHDTVK